MFSILNKHGGLAVKKKADAAYRTVVLLLMAVLFLAGLSLVTAAAAQGREPDAGVGPEQSGPASQAQTKIVGNRSISSDTLRKAAAAELDDFFKGGFNSADADDAAYQMELLYRDQGYRFATVDYDIERPTGGEPLLTFIVQEGPRVRVTEIVLTGNVGVSTGTLRQFFTAKAEGTAAADGWLVDSAIDAAIEAIGTYYYTNGYLQAVISAPRYNFSADRTRVSVVVAIDEGTRFVVRDLVFSGDLLAGAETGLEKIRQSLAGQPYVGRQTTFLLESRITELYDDLGYPDVTIEVKSLENRPADEVAGKSAGRTSGDVVLRASITSGPRVTISGLKITGNVKTSRDFIVSRLQLRVGDVYSGAKKRESFSRLYRTGLFSLVRLSLVKTAEKGRRLLLVELKELPSREVSVELGWGSYEMLRGKVEYRNKNFTGRGRVISGSVAASMKSTDLSLGFSEPWLFGRDLVFDLPVYYRTRSEPSFDRTEKGISSVLSKHFDEAKVGVSLAYLLRYTQQSDVTAGITEAGNDYNYASLKLQASRDTRDDLFFPAKGYRSLVSLELTDPTLGSSLAFVRFIATNRFFFGIGPRTVLGVRYDTGFVVPTTEDLTLPLAERFYNGGAETVRSFRHSELGPKDPVTGNPLGGSAYNVFSLELRQRFKHNFGASLFADFGNISPSGEGGVDRFTDKSSFVSATFRDYFSDMRSALGVGVLYLLPVGPIRLDIAFNPSVDEKQRENTYTIHFTVGMAF